MNIRRKDFYTESTSSAGINQMLKSSIGNRMLTLVVIIYEELRNRINALLTFIIILGIVLSDCCK